MILSGTREIAASAPAIPLHNTVLSQYGVKFRRGQFSIVAAAPGVGKSVFATNIVLHAEAESMYCSIDSDEWTVMHRLLGAITGEDLDEIDRKFNASQVWDDYYSKKLVEYGSHIDWSFNPAADTDYIVKRIEAHDAVWGQLPEMIVVDNIMDMTTGSHEEFAELRTICRSLRTVARETDAHIMALHHVNGEKENGNVPINLKDLQGKLGKASEVVLGLSFYGQDKLLVTVPKNRGGKRGLYIHLPINYSTGQIGGFNV